ncbi:hypothetical protein GWI33_015449 [Rhynchophorus ferrugineus]|uniref:Uncharacterized protein n=1 Tax=Rhynchophorus ferrugineus TaxID=354439 RepID=A0A834M603_RHYFE|nr:hypothetical protein GWI33_015449 [Rhynchophorus ferrugineus]
MVQLTESEIYRALLGEEDDLVVRKWESDIDFGHLSIQSNTDIEVDLELLCFELECDDNIHLSVLHQTNASYYIGRYGATKRQKDPPNNYILIRAANIIMHLRSTMTIA